MKKGIFAFLFFLLVFNVTTLASFTTCKSKYALCTKAKCHAISGKKGIVACECLVKNGYSIGTESCTSLKKNTDHNYLKSRYSPIKGYIQCTNSRPWAWCLDKLCIVNRKSPSKAICACSVTKNRGPYVVVANRYFSTACTSDLYSSATIKDVNKISHFAKTQKQIKVFPIKIYKK